MRLIFFLQKIIFLNLILFVVKNQIPQTGNFQYIQDFNSVANPQIWSDYNQSQFTDKCQSQTTFEYTLNGISGHFTAVGCGCNLLIIQTTTGNIIKSWGGFRYRVSSFSVARYNIEKIIYYDNKLFLFTVTRCLVISNLNSQNDQIQYDLNATYPDMNEYPYIVRSGFQLQSIFHYKQGPNYSQYVFINRQGTDQSSVDVFDLSTLTYQTAIISYQSYMNQIYDTEFVLGKVNNFLYLWNFSGFDANFNYDSAQLSVSIQLSAEWYNIVNFNGQNKFLSIDNQQNIGLFEYSYPLQKNDQNTINLIKTYSTGFDLSYISQVQESIIVCGDLQGGIKIFSLQDINMLNILEEYSLDISYQIYNVEKIEGLNLFIALGGIHSIFIQQICQIDCQQCTMTSCISCLDSSLTVPNCSCEAQQYLDLINNQCSSCNITCKECATNENKCTSCDELSNLILNIDLNICECQFQDQFFNINTLQCEQCTQEACQYKCADNEYYDTQTVICELCTEAKCSSMCTQNQYYDINANMCQLCNIDKCPCELGKFYDITTNLCTLCQNNCKSCIDEANKCTDCFENFTLENNNCNQIISQENKQGQNLIENNFQNEQEQTASVKASATATAAVEKSSKVVVSSFFLLAIFGYFYMLISIIDFTQLLFMLMYINLNYKPNLLAFFKALQSFALPYIPHMFKYWAYDEDEIRKQDKAPENFTKHGYYSFFLENIGLSFTILLIPFAFIIVFYLLGFKTKQTKNKYINMILVKCQKIFLNMRYSSPIELMFMEFVNIPAACLMQIFQFQNFEWNFQTLLIYSLWLITSFFVIFYPVYFHIKTVQYVKTRNESFREKFGHLWSGCKIDKPSSICFNYLLHYRKIIYAMIIIPFYNFPHLQIILLGVVHILLIIYMLYVQPFTTKGSLIVNVITEAVFVMCLFIILFACNEEICTDNGTVIIFSALAVLLMHITYIVSQIIQEKVQNLKQYLKNKQKLKRQAGNRKMAFNSEQIGMVLQQVNENNQQKQQINQEYNQVVPESNIQSRDQSVHLISILPPQQNQKTQSIYSSNNSQENKTEEWDPNQPQEKKEKEEKISMIDIPQKSSSRQLRNNSAELTVDSDIHQDKIIKKPKIRKSRQKNPYLGSLDQIIQNENQFRFTIKSLNNIPNNEQEQNNNFMKNNYLLSPNSIQNSMNMSNSIQVINDSKSNLQNDDFQSQNQSSQNINVDEKFQQQAKPRKLRKKKQKQLQ